MTEQHIFKFKYLVHTCIKQQKKEKRNYKTVAIEVYKIYIN